MKRFAAHYIYLGHGELLKNQVICFDDLGFILSFEPLLEEIPSTLFLNGILCAAFGLSGSNSLMKIEEAQSFFKNSKAKHSQISVKDFLQNQTNDMELKVGSRPTLWCIDSLDLKNLLLLEETTVYSVLP